MVFSDRTYSVLVLSSSDKANEMICGILPCGLFYPVTVIPTVGEAKRTVIERFYDVIIINAPLPDEMGTDFALDVCSKSDSGVLMLVKSEQYEEISAAVCPYGVLTIAKPTSKQTLYQSVRLLCATRERIRKYEKTADTIEAKMEEIRLVNRAKWTLIEYLKMTEPEAHRFIEKQAMDMRITKRAAAENILRTYES